MKTEEIGGSGSWWHGRPLVKSFDDLGWGIPNFPGGDGFVDAYNAELRKAISTGAPPLTGYGDGTPLRVENLDSTMSEVLLTNAHLKLFNSIPRVANMQPDYQWNRHTNYGTTRRPAGFREGSNPEGGVSSWVRNTIRGKYLGVKRGYTHQALITGQMGGFVNDPVTSENRDGTLQLLEQVERAILWGNKDIPDSSGNEVNYDGIYQQLLDDGSTSIIDKEGLPLDFDDFENAALTLVERGKMLDFSNLKAFAKPFVFSDLSLLKQQQMWAEVKQSRPSGGFSTGMPLLGHLTQFGWIPFEPSIMMDAVPEGKMLATSEVGVTALRPATVTMAMAADATSKIVAGTYYYFASTVEKNGETDFRASTATVVAAGEKATGTIARVTTAIAYNVYRGLLSSGADAGWIATVPQPGSGDGVFVDLNQIRPGTGMFLMFNAVPKTIVLPQMSPLIKFPLAVVQTQFDFDLLIYHCLVIKEAERVILIKNIGRRT